MLSCASANVHCKQRWRRRVNSDSTERVADQRQPGNKTDAAGWLTKLPFHPYLVHSLPVQRQENFEYLFVASLEAGVVLGRGSSNETSVEAC